MNNFANSLFIAIFQYSFYFSVFKNSLVINTTYLASQKENIHEC